MKRGVPRGNWNLMRGLSQCPQVAQEPEEHVAHEAAPPRPLPGSPPAVANVENFLWTFRVPQSGHVGGLRTVVERNSFSNSVPQSSQANSYIGIVRSSSDGVRTIGYSMAADGAAQAGRWGVRCAGATDCSPIRACRSGNTV